MFFSDFCVLIDVLSLERTRKQSNEESVESYTERKHSNK
jgi:hypothetical protein